MLVSSFYLHFFCFVQKGANEKTPALEIRQESFLTLLLAFAALVGFLVILGLHLEICLGMVAHGALLWSFLADDDMSAVGALPNDVTLF